MSEPSADGPEVPDLPEAPAVRGLRLLLPPLELGPADGPGDRRRAFIALTTAALVLFGIETFGDSGTLDRLSGVLARPDAPDPLGLAGPWSDLVRLGYWVFARVVGYFVVPALALRLVAGRVRDQHLEVRGLGAHLPLYAGLFALVLGPLLLASRTPSFQAYYPFYAQAGRSVADLLAWEFLYAAQFFALEFFFRGYLLAQCRGAFGGLAVAVSAVPYVMIHFGKPPLETLGALFAGLGLGALAMRTRSILLGVGVHVAVAVAMDLAALAGRGELPGRVWPDLVGAP